jgi:FixJ family two-component response regulator
MSNPTHDVGIIDDDESGCRALSRLLRGVGFEPTTFRSAEDFLASSPLHPPFACLLVDVQLDGMSGLELHRHLLERGSRTPVIFITAHDDPAIRTEALRNGCAGFFRKTDPGVMAIEAIRRAASHGGS